MVLLITYDLKRPGQDYAELYAEIKKAGTWWHHLGSTWIIETTSSPKHWYERLAPHIDGNDNLIIFEITSNYYGWAPQKAWDWLAKRNFRV
ncbi:MAG: hypothetical protein HY527_19420 [Betaproteobacteria bacterium]|nr:hypothetical protein [Betaproteobacteria bacterium]